MAIAEEVPEGIKEFEITLSGKYVHCYCSYASEPNSKILNCM